MKKRLEKILSDLITDYEVTRTNAESLEDLTSQDVAMQAMANNLVLIQTQLNNMVLWNNVLLANEELVQKKLLTADLKEYGVDRSDQANRK